MNAHRYHTQIEVSGGIVFAPPFPDSVKISTGFKSASEVQRALAKNCPKPMPMRLDDVQDMFDRRAFV